MCPLFSAIAPPIFYFLLSDFGLSAIISRLIRIDVEFALYIQSFYHTLRWTVALSCAIKTLQLLINQQL